MNELTDVVHQAFVSYLRSIYLHKDKSVFKLDALPVDRFAESLGLPGTPKIKFLNREIAKAKKNASREVVEAQAPGSDPDAEDSGSDPEASGSEDESEGSDGEGSDAPVKVLENTANVSSSPLIGIEVDSLLKQRNGVRTKYDKMFQRKNQNVLSTHYSKLIEHDAFGNDGDAEEDDFITLKRADHDLPETLKALDPAQEISKRKQKLSRAKKLIATGGSNHKLIFDDEGKPHEIYELADADDWMNDKGGAEGARQEGQRFAEEERAKIKLTDVIDKAEAREKKKEKKRKRKDQERMVRSNL